MRYLLLNKPYEVLTQFTDENGRATLKDFVTVPDVYPVGRLDYDSEGLVLLTDDKQLQHRLSEPRFKVPKTYWVQVEGEPTEAALAELRRGVDLKTGFTTPADVALLPDAPDLWERSKPVRFRANIPTSWLQITISQGMNRQVRKMTAAVGFPTLRLVRAQITTLDLAGLAAGQWRELTEAEVKSLRELTAAQAAATGLTAGTANRKPGGFWPGGIRPAGAKPAPNSRSGFGSKPSGASAPGGKGKSSGPRRGGASAPGGKGKSGGPGRGGDGRKPGGGRKG